VLLAFVPVLFFVTELRLLDSYKLVCRSAAITSIVWGGAAAIACLSIHQSLLASELVDLQTAGRYIAPVTEETLKALFAAILIARRRIGFSVDAVIHGFAIGTGFALVENAVYLRSLGEASIVLWTVRGFGTAVLHGATTAIFAMISRTLVESGRVRQALAFAPGWLAAVLIHAIFNRAWISPIAMTLALFVAAPALVLLVFRRSERATREWLGPGWTSMWSCWIFSGPSASIRRGADSICGSFATTSRLRPWPTWCVSFVCGSSSRFRRRRCCWLARPDWSCCPTPTFRRA
jgi:RsiW-degrading membrane proteinase PrsW (M82 family)